jgi:hypothetical protein
MIDAINDSIDPAGGKERMRLLRPVTSGLARKS